MATNFFCCACVDQANVGVLEQWGRFVRLLKPGFSVFNPFLGERIAGVLSLKVTNLDIRCETKTKDNVFVSLHCAIQYRVVQEKANNAFYELQKPKEQIQSYVFDVIRAGVPKLSLDDVFEQKNQIAREVLEELEKVMGTYGYKIVQILIVDIIPDPDVRRAMNEINAAERSKTAAEFKGEAEKILQVKRAEADAESKYLSGLGIARQRQAITDGLKESVLAFSGKVPGATPKEVMDMVLVTQYFDTMKDIGSSSKNTAIFLPHGPGHVNDISQQIQTGIVQGNTVTSLIDS